MTTTRGVARLALLISVLAAGCGDNIHPGGGELLVSPQTGLVTTEGGGTATFTVALTNAPYADATVTLASSNTNEGTVSPATLAFTALNWNDPQTVTVVGVPDHIVDGNRAYTVTVAGDTSSHLGAVDVSLTNLDQDVASFTIAPSSGLVTTKAGGTATFTVQLTAQPAAPVTLPLASSNPMQGTIDHSSLTFAADTWNVPQSVTITGVDDGLPDGNVQYMITTGAATSADANFNGVDPDDVFVTNLGHALTALEVTPVGAAIALGTGQQYVATALLDDNTTLDVTQAVTWSSSVGTVATISNTGGTTGFATSHDLGTTTIQADWLGKSGSTSLTVTHATLSSIEVTPANPTIARGTNQQFAATGIYTDNSTQDLTNQVVWSSSDINIATISNNSGSQGRAHAVDQGSTTIQAALGTVTGSTTLTVTAATLVSIDVSPANPTVAKGTSQQFTATGLYTDGTTQPLTATVTWASTATTIATISNAPGTKGLASTLAVGSTTITATQNGITGSALLTVTAATLSSIEITPTNPSTTRGATLQFTATGIYSDSSTQNLTTQVTWASSLTSVATISNASGSQGLATAQAVGQTTISATFGTVTGSTFLTVKPATLVSVQVTPTTPSAAKGTTVQFTAIATFSDNSTQNVTTQATWASNTGTVASISNASGSQGLASALGVGTTTISATFGGVIGSTTLTVTSAALVSISITPTDPSIAKGTSVQFTASGLYTDGTSQDLTTQASWASTNSLIADVGATTGLAHGNSTGTVTISATFGGKTGTTTLTVTPATLVSISVVPADPSIAKGSDLQFTALGTYTDSTVQNLTAQVTWTSLVNTVATISNAAGSQGLAHAAGVGTTTIRATFGGKTGTTLLTVTAATLASIQVTPVDPSIAKGTNLQFTATGVFTDGTTQDVTAQVTWSSSTSTVATISNVSGSSGLAHAVAAGSTNITATLGTINGSTTLTVTAATLTAIQVTPSGPSIAKGTTLQFTATAVYSDGTIQNVTTQAGWSSSLPTVATVSTASGSQGLASAVSAGQTTIQATFGGASGSTTLTVTAATLVSLSISPTDPSIANGTTQQFTVTGVYSDNTTQDLTTAAFWASSLTTVATISNGPSSFGLATGTGPGTTTISASYGGLMTSTSLTVTGVVLTGVFVTPVNPTLAKGTTAQFTCTGVYSDNTTQDLTASALWATTNAAAASVSNASGSQGLVTAVDVGSADISCAVGAFSDTSTVTVTGATITSIDVSPATPSIAAGVQLQFTATVHYSNGIVQDITDSATWTSSNTSAATISNQTGFAGLATTIAAGTTTITASFGGASGTATLTVTAATLTSIAITPINPTIAKSTQVQFVATGTFSDGTTADITTVATWQSSNTTAATISNQTGLQGLSTGVAAGTSTISATYKGMTASTTLTVTNAVLVSITVTPANPTVTAGTQIQFTATGTFSDGSTQNLTIQCNWSSSNRFVAKATNARRKRGLVTSISAGVATISATTLGVTGSTTLTVQ